MNFRYPVFLDLTGKRALVVGTGYEIPSKVQALVDASANVLYVNETADPKIEALAAAGLIEWKKRSFEAADLENCMVVIADTVDNSEIFRLAEERRILCNSVDDPRNCRFSFGSVHRQGDLTVAISTNGWAPSVAVRLREKLEREIGPEYGTLLKMLKKVRREITSRIADFSARRELWYRIVDSDVLELLKAGREPDAEARIRALIENAVELNSLPAACEPPLGQQRNPRE